jgi:rRNA processing protein Krr1/Pno1
VLYETGDDNGAAQALGEAAEIVRAFASSLSPERAAALLDAPRVREILIV